MIRNSRSDCFDSLDGRTISVIAATLMVPRGSMSEKFLKYLAKKEKKKKRKSKKREKKRKKEKKKRKREKKRKKREKKREKETRKRNGNDIQNLGVIENQPASFK